jgi:hypothetical protein
LLFCLPQLSVAQSFHSKSEVRDMFNADNRNLWINYLSGTIEGGHTIDMIIGSDGKSCKGLYTMRSSKVTNSFEGDEVDKQLQLIELDAEGRHTGFLIGKYDGQRFDGVWMDKTKKRVIPFHLGFVNAFSDYKPSLCKTTNWQHYYSGKIDDKPIKLNIKRESDIVSYQLWYKNTLFSDAMIKPQVERIYNLPMGPTSPFDGMSIVLDTLDITKVAFAALDDNNYEDNQFLKLDRSMTTQCTEYIDQVCLMTCKSPLLGHQKFDQWLEKQCNEWYKKNTKELTSSKNQKLGLADRWSQSAESWVEVSLFLDDLISGTIYFQSSWHNGTEMIPFIYNLNEGRELKIKDIFTADANIREVFDQYIEAENSTKEMSMAQKSWIAEQGFPHTILSSDGVVLKSPFSTIYGELAVVIPYPAMIEKIKNKAILKDILLK